MEFQGFEGGGVVIFLRLVVVFVMVCQGEVGMSRYILGNKKLLKLV